MKHIFLVVFSLHFFAFSVNAQKFGYPKVEERQLIGTKWRYAYTLQLESNTTIHQADKGYQYFLYFKYDYSYEQFLHGKLTRGAWALNGSTLFYNFRNIRKFDIAAINSKSLVLEFQQPNSNGTYQYHFVAVDSKEAPFVRPADELPEVIVEAYPSNNKKRGWWNVLHSNEKKEDKETASVPKKTTQTYISVELVGGGYFGGIDPVVKDFIKINTDGRLIQEFQTIGQPLRVVKKTIGRAELEQFAEYVMQNKFFDMQRMYDCNAEACTKRKVMKPTPIPLRLQITYGDKRKVVTIAIWGLDQHKIRYVDYPPALDNIIDAIQRFAHRDEKRLGVK